MAYGHAGNDFVLDSDLTRGGSALLVPPSRYRAAASFVVAAMHGNPIIGTEASEFLEGTNGPDDIEGLGGGDTIHGKPGDDHVDGGGGGDWIHGGWGDDTLIGGPGGDVLIGGPGADALIGGAGNDSYFLDNAGDAVVELANEGYDGVRSRVNFTLGANIEALRLMGTATVGTGNEIGNYIIASYLPSTLSGLGGNDYIKGTKSADSIDGGTGDDTLDGWEGDDIIHGGEGNDLIKGGWGRDHLYGDDGDDVIYAFYHADVFGGNGNDALHHGRLIDGGEGDDRIFGGAASNLIVGGAGRDMMSGDRGADTFIFDDGDFAGLETHSADRIWDLNSAENDRIDLSAVDAIAGGTDNAFDYIGNAEFSGTAGELRWVHYGRQTMIYMDTDGDKVSDYAINLLGNVALTEASFIL